MNFQNTHIYNIYSINTDIIDNRFNLDNYNLFTFLPKNNYNLFTLYFRQMLIIYLIKYGL